LAHFDCYFGTWNDHEDGKASREEEEAVGVALS
jgi:hypothetical protein